MTAHARADGQADGGTAPSPVGLPAMSSALSSPSPIVCGVATRQGLRRAGNQDCAHARSLARGGWRGATLALVADGLGAYSNSAEASALATQTMIETLEALEATGRARESLGGAREMRAALLAAAQAANLALWRAAQTRNETLRTTLTALLGAPAIDGQAAQIALAHVGDCRAYLARAGELRLLTHDHTFAAEARTLTRLIALAGRPFGRAWAPPRHILSRALGADPIVRVDTLVYAAQPGDRFVLCCDGVWGSLDASAFTALVQSKGDTQTLADRLVAAAQEADSPDDVSAVVVSFA